jgi:hypothetical protein
LFNGTVEETRLRGGLDEPVKGGVVTSTTEETRNVDEGFVGEPVSCFDDTDSVVWVGREAVG